MAMLGLEYPVLFFSPFFACCKLLLCFFGAQYVLFFPLGRRTWCFVNNLSLSDIRTHELNSQSFSITSCHMSSCTVVFQQDSFTNHPALLIPSIHLSAPFAPLDLGWELHLLAPHTLMRGIWGASEGVLGQERNSLLQVQGKLLPKSVTGC